jgi:hypothetical protein
VENPWLGVVFDAVAERLGAPMPPPNTPHPFALDDAGRLAFVLTEAGLADVSVRELATPYRAASADEWWDRTSAPAGPLAQRMAALPEPAVARPHAVSDETTPPRAAVGLGGRNLGAAIARDLLERGVRVASVARTPADLQVTGALPRGGPGAAGRPVAAVRRPAGASTRRPARRSLGR